MQAQHFRRDALRGFQLRCDCLDFIVHLARTRVMLETHLQVLRLVDEGRPRWSAGLPGGDGDLSSLKLCLLWSLLCTMTFFGYIRQLLYCAPRR